MNEELYKLCLDYLLYKAPTHSLCDKSFHKFYEAFKISKKVYGNSLDLSSTEEYKLATKYKKELESLPAYRNLFE